MALSIKNPETERLARDLARATGKSLTTVVTEALRECMLRETGRGADATLEADLRAIQERVARLPVLDPRTPDEILGYDENGLPN